MKNELKEIKRLLIVVDMVNGFIREGKMKDPYIEHIINETVRLTEMFLKKDAVAFIRDYHKIGSIEFNRFPVHCLEGTRESEMVDELKKYEKEVLTYKKNSTSTMFAKNFMTDIEKMKQLKEIVVVGCCTDICILNLVLPLRNYFDEINQKTEIIVPQNAVETFNSDLHNREYYNKAAFDLMKNAGIRLVKKYEGGYSYGK